MEVLRGIQSNGLSGYLGFFLSKYTPLPAIYIVDHNMHLLPSGEHIFVAVREQNIQYCVNTIWSLVCVWGGQT